MSEPWTLYEDAITLANICICEGDWETLWEIRDLAQKRWHETNWMVDGQKDMLARLAWAADHPGEPGKPGKPYKSPYLAANRQWDYIVRAIASVPPIAARIEAERQAYEAGEKRRAEEGQRARERQEEQKRAEAERRAAKLAEGEAAYLKAVTTTDSAKLGARWNRVVVSNKRPKRYQRVEEICRRPYPADRYQHLLAEHLADQLWDLKELGENWNADDRSLGWLADHFEEAGGYADVFWHEVARVVSDDDTQDDDQPATDLTPEQLALADKLYADQDYRAAVRQTVRDSNHGNLREIAHGAAELCGGDAESIRSHIVVPMSKARQIVKVDANGNVVEQNKRGHYVLAE